MDTSTILILIILTACKVVYLTSTWEDPLLEHYGFDSAMSIAVPLESAQDGYIHRILIGSNSQKFDVMVTMRSSMLWVPKAGCKGSGSRTTYSPSPSFARDGRNWTQKSNGGTINGELGIDDVTIGGSLKPRCNFGMATSISADTILPVDGVLGLAPISESSNPSQPFITQIKDLLTSHIFTIYLSQQSGSNAGSVTYGSANKDNCVTAGSTQAFTSAYYFRITSVSLGNFTHTYMNTAVPELISFITGPQEDIEGLAKAAGATPISGLYEIRCNATIPKLDIKASRWTYSIRSNKLIVKNTDYYTKKHNELFNKNYSQNTLYHTKKKYHYLVNENNSQNPDYYTEEDQHLYTENNSQNTNYYDKRKYDYFVNENNSPVIFTNRIMTIVSTNPCQTPNYYTKENKHFLKENDSQNNIHHIKKCNHVQTKDN